MAGLAAFRNIILHSSANWMKEAKQTPGENLLSVMPRPGRGGRSPVFGLLICWPRVHLFPCSPPPWLATAASLLTSKASPPFEVTCGCVGGGGSGKPDSNLWPPGKEEWLWQMPELLPRALVSARRTPTLQGKFNTHHHPPPRPGLLSFGVYLHGPLSLSRLGNVIAAWGEGGGNGLRKPPARLELEPGAHWRMTSLLWSSLGSSIT